MKLKCRIQRTLITAHLAEDNGDFVFVLCRRGIEKELGRRFSVGEDVVLDVDIKIAGQDGRKTASGM